MKAARKQLGKEVAAAKVKANPDQKPKGRGRGTANYHVNEDLTDGCFASNKKKSKFKLDETDNNRQYSRRMTLAKHLKTHRYYCTHDLGPSKTADGKRDRACLQGTCPLWDVSRYPSVSAFRRKSHIFAIAICH